MNFIKKITWLFSMMALVCSCNNDLEEPVVNNQPDGVVTKSANEDVYVKKGMLVFNSMSQLNNTAEELNMSVENQRSLGVGTMGFLSQKDIFDQIIIDEDEYEEKYLQVTEAEAKKINPATAHSELYLEMRDKGIIKEFFEEDGMSYDYAICDPMYASVINENGFVAVGDTVYYVDSEKVACWKNADFNRLDMLKKATMTDSVKEIYVINSKAVTRGTPVDEQWQEIKYADGFRDGKKYKYALHLHFQVMEWLGNRPGTDRDEISISYKYYMSIKSKKKKPLGGYKYRVSQAEFWGNVSGRASCYPRDQFTADILVTNSGSDHFKGGIANSYLGLKFFGERKTTGNWDSTYTLSFSRGTEALYYHTISTSYDYKGVFEENVTVTMSGGININGYNHSVSY